ncbi:hypothetical protein LZ32DRAFT_115447 [Colletotrichum eremochloae]|nr:hypothetical protein LZ32DRAFT_115447 [Colletotrichum eremochloae]
MLTSYLLPMLGAISFLGTRSSGVDKSPSLAYRHGVKVPRAAAALTRNDIFNWTQLATDGATDCDILNSMGPACCDPRSYGIPAISAVLVCTLLHCPYPARESNGLARPMEVSLAI